VKCAGYEIRGTERKIIHLLCKDDLKLTGRSEKELNKIRIMKKWRHEFVV
jgi:hypothetical protein